MPDEPAAGLPGKWRDLSQSLGTFRKTAGLSAKSRGFRENDGTSREVSRLSREKARLSAKPRDFQENGGTSREVPRLPRKRRDFPRSPATLRQTRDMAGKSRDFARKKETGRKMSLSADGVGLFPRKWPAPERSPGTSAQGSIGRLIAGQILARRPGVSRSRRISRAAPEFLSHPKKSSGLASNAASPSLSRAKDSWTSLFHPDRDASRFGVDEWRPVAPERRPRLSSISA